MLTPQTALIHPIVIRAIGRPHRAHVADLETVGTAAEGVALGILLSTSTARRPLVLKRQARVRPGSAPARSESSLEVQLTPDTACSTGCYAFDPNAAFARSTPSTIRSTHPSSSIRGSVGLHSTVRLTRFTEVSGP